MRIPHILAITLTVVALRVQTVAAMESFMLDASRTSVRFRIGHMLVSSVTGTFTAVSGVLQFEPQDPTRSTLNVTIQTASIDTRNRKRDDHLRTADFFDVALHPMITFQSKTVTAVGPGRFRVTGDLSIRGVTHESVLDVEGAPDPQPDSEGVRRLQGTARARLDRHDFGVGGGSAVSDALIGDEVEVVIDAVFVQPANSAPWARSP